MSVIPPSPTVPPSPSTPSSSDWTASPRKRDPNLQPNAHPYAIRTTSTALLSRSGSSASTPVRHFYLPPPPPSPSLSRPGLGHRNTKSLDDRDKLGEALFGVPAMEIPRPLPAPPGQNRAGSASPNHRMIEAIPTSTDVNTDGNDNTTPNAQRRIKPRAETLPTLPFTFPGPLDTPGSSDDIIAALEHELPSNPKTWTPSQLASYLLTALRVQSPSFDSETTETSNEPIAPGIARDVASFVRSAAISGRVFLRLNDDDLDELSVPTPWRAPLLASSRALRQNVLRGRIFGFGSPVLGGDENEQYALHSPSSEPSLSAFMSGNGAPLRSPSLARLETGHLRRSRSGRVKGMVQHLERGASGSESDASDASSTSSRPSSPIRPSVLHHHHPRGTVTRVPSDPPPQYSPFRAPRALPSPPEVPEEAESPIVEEQSMQELLAAQGVEPAWGARAWETEGVGETVKHVPAAATGPAQFGSMRRRELSDEDEDVNIRRSMDDLFTPDTTSLRHSGTAKSISRTSGARAFGTASRAGTRAARGAEGRRLVSALFMPDNAPANVVEPTDDKAVIAAREAEHAQTQENIQQAEPVRSLPTGLGIDHVPQAFVMPEASHAFEALPEPVYEAQPVSMPTYTPAMPEPEPAPAVVAMPVPVPAVSPPVQEKVEREEDDGTAAHIAALESELALTRSALDTMRARLSAVEARMDAIDASSAERSAVLSAALEGIKARETELRDACKVAENAQGEAQKAKEEAEKMAREMKEEREREEARRKERALDKATRHAIVDEDGSLGKVVPGLPRGVAELPQYVLLVGLGVCAVALQVVFGRAGGRRLR